jgi:hypothetical protein
MTAIPGCMEHVVRERCRDRLRKESFWSTAVSMPEHLSPKDVEAKEKIFPDNIPA